MVKAIIDSKLEHWLSKKLLVWLTTTGMFLFDKVDADNYFMITMAYVGTQGFIDAVMKWKSISIPKLP